MKKLYIYLLGLLFIFSMHSCMDVNDKFENLDEISAPPNDEKETYTLTSEDYGSIADFALDADANDTLNADTIADYEFFTNTVSAAKYIPALLAEKYPAFGFQSSAMITYNFNPDNNYPLYQERFDKVKIYEVDSADYAFVSEESVENMAFTPNYPADENLPLVLARAFAGKSNIYYAYAKYNYSKGDLTTYFEESFPENLNNYTIIDNLGTQTWTQSSYGSDTFAKISGYDGTQDNDNEDWLITKGINLSDVASNANLEFTHAINYLDNLNAPNEKANVYISTNFNGTDVATATWVNISDQINWPKENSFTWVNSGAISLSPYLGETIYIAFVYTGSVADSPTWEINNISIYAGSAPYERGDYYKYNNGQYTKVSGVYVMDDLDYESLGAPGKYNNFSDDEPADAYLPDFLAGLITTPYVGQVEKIAYTEYSGGTKYRVDEYEYIGAATWQKYSPVIEREDQFIIDNTGHWVFDPTITHNMSKADYQIIVDWVKNKDVKYIDAYGTADSYFGTSAYYGEFRSKAEYFESNDFATSDDAIEFALSQVFLPTVYPNAQLQVDGIDQVFIVKYYVYESSMVEASMTFKVTKAGPDPEFTIVKEEE